MELFSIRIQRTFQLVSTVIMSFISKKLVYLFTFPKFKVNK